MPMKQTNDFFVSSYIHFANDTNLMPLKRTNNFFVMRLLSEKLSCQNIQVCFVVFNSA